MKSLNYSCLVAILLFYGLNMNIHKPYNPRVNARIAACFEHSIVIDGGQVYTWGDNLNAQLGNEDLDYLAQPTLVENLNDIIAIGQGSAAKHSIVLKEDGTVWSWGDNEFGQLGIGNSDIINSSTPRRIEGVHGVVAVAVGNKHSLALTDEGNVWSWGNNTEGQIGHANQTESYVPKLIHGLTNVVSIASGYSHSIVLKEDGTVWTWGENNFGQLGIGNKSTLVKPVQVAGLENIVYISAGAGHCIAVKGDGTVWTWGWNDYGQLGDGTFETRLKPVKSKVTNVVKVSAGGLHNTALTAMGEVIAWGSNTFGQLGKSRVRNYPVPVKVYALQDVIEIASGDMHSMAVLQDGTVKTWGSNSSGQLGLEGDLRSFTLHEAYKIKTDLPQALTALNGEVPTRLPIEDKYFPPIKTDLVEVDVIIDQNNQARGEEEKIEEEVNEFGIPEEFGQAAMEDCPVLDMMHSLNLSLACTEATDAIILRWKAPLETANLEFVIEKSFDNENWLETGIVTDIQEHNRYYYCEATDYAHSNKKSFYRIKQYDCDVNYTYSVTAMIDCAYSVPSNDLIDVSPESSSSNFTVYFREGIKKGYKYIVKDVNGRVVLSEKINSSKSVQSLTINGTTLKDGVYRLQVVNMKSNLPLFTKKIVKIEN
jgi:alpha-tubulin suppressor-like RCC1 family protein